MGKVQCYPHILIMGKKNIIAKYSTKPPPVPVPCTPRHGAPAPFHAPSGICRFEGGVLQKQSVTSEIFQNLR